MNEFMTLDNLKECEARFVAHMDANHGVRFERDEDRARLRRLLYGVMGDVKQQQPRGGGAADKTPAQQLRALNNATLNAAREAVLASGGPQQQQQQQQPLQQQQQQQQGQQQPLQQGHVLDRDRDVYGERKVRFAPFADPDATRLTLESNADDLFKRAEQARDEERRAAAAPPAWDDVSRPTVSVGAMDASEFDSRLADLASSRASLSPPLSDGGPQQHVVKHAHPHAHPHPHNRTRADDWPSSSSSTPPMGGSPDGLEFARSLRRDADDANVRIGMSHLSRHGLDDAAADAVGDAIGAGPDLMPLPSTRASLLIPRPKLTHTVVNYLALNAADRDLTAQPSRFHFTVRTGGRQSASSLQGTYNNVAWIEATRILLPMEVVQATGSVVMPKGYYNLAYSFAYPYVVLLIEGFNDMYDGTNELARRAFCTFIYDNEYKAPNGRGYLMLRPAQDERKTYSTPLGTLPDLAISIAKPNGTLFNNSQDAYTVSMLIYEPNNRLFIKVVVDQYFDRNEYWVGDWVRLSGMTLAMAPTASATSAAAAYHAALQAYVNRPEGFEIVQLGTSNPQGFYNAFYVLAPGVLDQSKGSVIIDANLSGVVSAMATGAVTVATPARLMNASLQPVVTMRIGCLRGDVGGPTLPEA